MSDGVADGTAESPTPPPPAAPEPPLLDAPREGVPAVIDDAAALAEAVAAFGSATGPVAVDAERASGHRYGQRAFLVQLRREGAGTALVDPTALPDLTELGAAIEDAEWVLHAAGQDLACLAEVGLRPRRLFDTELASRLAGLARVGLAAVVEQLLGVRLAKEHSAVDWSTRPLPEPWLRYAALDVEVLVALRDVLADELARQGKLEWAAEEFAALAGFRPPPARPDPWRRTSGLHRVRTRRQLATVRELWQAREDLARAQDVSPRRLIPDSSLVEAALAQPAGSQELAALKSFTGRAARRELPRWAAALSRAQRLAEADLPPHHLPAEGPPPARVWADKDPEAAARLNRARAAVQAIATAHDLPVENLISPDTVRRLCWTPPVPSDEAGVRATLDDLGARPWQIGLTLDALVDALTRST